MKSPLAAEVQIWTVGTGGGHRSVALALARELSSSSGGGLRVGVDDPTELGIGRTAVRLAAAYGPLVRSSPAAWGLLYRGFSGRAAGSGLNRFLVRQLVPSMARRTSLRAPRLVVNCHPLLGPAIAAAASAGPGRARPMVATVMTDLVGGHIGWLRPPPELILTATEEASAWCRVHGLEPSRIFQSGLPIDPELAPDPPDRSQRRALRVGLGLDPDRLCVLVAGGAEGVGHLRRLCRWLGSATAPLQLVVVCGHNRGLLNRLRGESSAIPRLALGFQPSLTPWLRAADVYLGKAGPSSLAEAAAAGLALLLTDALPGQEEHNAEVPAAAGAALRIRRRQQLLSVLARLSTPADPLLAELQRRAREWSRPTAAAAAAGRLLSLI